MYFDNISEFFQQIKKIIKERRFFYSVKYVLWVIVDKIRGYDFVKNEGYNKTGLDGDKSLVYQATRDIKSLEYAIKYVLDDIREEAAIIDVGCGKGYMLYRFSRYQFKRIGGMELSDYLFYKASYNINKMKDERCILYHEDAEDFVEYDDYNIVYMFNPFHDEIMTKVIANIECSINRYPRTFYIIYKNPVYDAVIRNSGKFELFKVVKGKTAPYFIYKAS